MKKFPRKSRPARVASAPPPPAASVAPAPDPVAENQRSLSAALARVRSALEAHSSADKAVPPSDDRPIAPRSALARLCAGFKLSSFERDLLLL